MKNKTAIIDYGAGNVQSVKNALLRLGYPSVITNDAAVIRQAERVIFPGVGHAQAAMKNLNATGLDSLIPTLKQPVLGICLGLQLMCGYCEEGQIQGLGIFDVDVKKFDASMKIPQIGWNRIENLKSDVFKGIKEKEFMFLVHSYYIPLNDACISTTTYGVKYASAMQKDNFHGVQFHPEKSSKAGGEILNNFLKL